MKAQTVAVVGLDRIGASVALALKRPELNLKILGFDHNASLAKEAEQKGVIHESRWNLVNVVEKADIVIFNVPAHLQEQNLKAILPYLQSHTLLLNLGNIQAAAQEWVKQTGQQVHYIGAKPIPNSQYLADGRTGLEAASADLFRGSIICLMPANDLEEKAVETATHLGIALGAKPFFITPSEYDQFNQGLEIVPALLATALFHTLAQTVAWRDMLRFASTPFALSTAPLTSPDLPFLASQERNATLRWLEALITHLQQLRQQLQMGEMETITALLQEAQDQRQKWLAERAQNDWEESPTDNLDPLTMSDRLLGTFATRRKKSDN